jgi:hypothetical protein
VCVSGRYIVYFTGLWAHFDAIDRNHDGRLDATEFLAGCRSALSCVFSPVPARAGIAAALS